MKIALCDDNQQCLDYVKHMIETYFNQHQETFTIEVFSSAEEMVFKIGDSVPFDLVILDIQMGEMNGMELAKKIRGIDRTIFIVFLTGISDYVFDGYEVGALRYLLKPLKESNLFALLDDVRTKISLNNNQYYIFTINREKVKIYLEDIIYLESLGHYVIIHTKNQVFEVKKGLNELVKELDSEVFIHTHRSYVANLKHIEKITKDRCLMSNNDTIHVSRGNYNHLNDRFIHYYRSFDL